MKIEVDENLTEQLNHIQDASNLPNTKIAFNHIVKSIQRQWKGWAMGDEIDGIDNIKHPSNNLYRSIKVDNKGDFHSVVYSNSMYAERIESGTPEVDMKQKYPYGRKSRVNKKGIPYLIIPFRWGAGKEAAHFRGNVVPDYLLSALRKMKESQKEQTTHFESNYKGEPIQRAEYKWGGRITEDMADNDRQVGLVRMANRGGYFTFRIISAKSPEDSWIRKEVKPIPVTETIVNNSQKKAEDVMAEAIKTDLLEL